MRIQMFDRQRRLQVSKSALRTIARAALAVEGPAHRFDGRPAARRGAEDAAGADDTYDEIGISLVTDRLMRDLNHAYRGLDRTTDVLAFDLRRPRAAGEPRVGEVLISTDRVVAQASRYRTTPARELARLLVHGLLHLEGFEHRRIGERQRMRAIERRLLAGLPSTIARLVTGRPRPAGDAPGGRRAARARVR